MSTFLAILLTPLSTSLYSQIDSTGVYLSHKDYQHHKLSLASDCQSKRHAIRVRGWWPAASIIVRRGEKRIKIRKHEIYGYRDCSGMDHRFFANEDLEMINTKGLFLYRQLQDFRQGGMDVQRYVYFFSESGESWVYPLCKQDLKWAFRKNVRFCTALDSLFGSDEELYSKDEKSKEFNIVRVFFGDWNIAD